jgi:hypothetical protein
MPTLHNHRPDRYSAYAPGIAARGFFVAPINRTKTVDKEATSRPCIAAMLSLDICDYSADDRGNKHE